MPDGFDPHRELQRIYTLRDYITECRARTPTVMQVLDECLSDNDPSIRLAAAKMAMDRAFGKVPLGVNLSFESANVNQTNRINTITLPSNGREKLPEGPVIDA